MRNDRKPKDGKDPWKTLGILTSLPLESGALAPPGRKTKMLLIVPQGRTKPCLQLRRKHEGPSGPKGTLRAREGSFVSEEGPYLEGRAVIRSYLS